MPRSLDCIFKPSAIAIVGASWDETKRGYQAVRGMKDSEFRGRIYPVNPKGGELLGFPVYRTLAEIPVVPDLALVCTPAHTVPDVLEACAAKGIAGAVVLALGFKESGETGQELEGRVSAIVGRTGIRVVGPNTSGIMNLSCGLNLIGVRGIRAGGQGLLVQSGNLALALMTETMARSRHGFSLCAGVGNETGIAFDEYLDYFAADPGTGVIMMYVEGFRRGAAFLESARRAARSKPIVCLKGGKTDAGRVSARSHTGAVAGSYEILRCGLRDAGVTEVTRTDELFHVAETLMTQPPVRPGSGIAILSDGGGHSTITADALMEQGLPLAVLRPESREELRRLLGPAACVLNPVDTAGAVDSDPSVFARSLRILMEDPEVGGVLQVGLFGGYGIRFSETLVPNECETAVLMADCAHRTGKPLVVHTLYAGARSWPLDLLREKGVPVVESLEVACRCIGAAVERGRYLARAPREDREPRTAVPSGSLSAGAPGRSRWTELEARELLASYGVTFSPASFCRSEQDVISVAQDICGPMALKVVANGILHKTDAGGVMLNVPDAAGAKQAFERIRRSAADYAAARGLAVDFQGVLLSPMLPAPVAEMIIGFKRDPQFGPVLITGIGGTAVEVFRDVSLRIPPVDRAEALLMLQEFRSSALLRGFRGRPAADLESLAANVCAVAACGLDYPEILEMELNPVFAYEHGAVGVDARIVLCSSSGVIS